MNKEDKNVAIHPNIQKAIDNDLYGLDRESFFRERIILFLKQIRQPLKKEKGYEFQADRNFFKSYLAHLAQPIVPNIELIKEMAFIAQGKNSDLKSEMNECLDKIFTVPSLLWSINNATDELSEALSQGLTKKINSKNYSMQEVIDNMSIVTQNPKRKILLSEIFLTKDSSSYLLLDKYISIGENTDKYLSIGKNDKIKIVENILKKNTAALLLNRDCVKDIFMKKIKEENWYEIDKYFQNLSANKIDFILDILSETRQEKQKEIADYEIDSNEKETQINIIKENRQAIKGLTRAIYMVIDKAIYLKNGDLVNKVIEIKKEQPNLTDIDIYALMIKRIYSYFKKDVAQEYCTKIMSLAKDNGDFDKLKEIVFENQESYDIKSLGIQLGMKDEYFRKEMKQYFMSYLEEKLEPKNIIIKVKKI